MSGVEGGVAIRSFRPLSCTRKLAKVELVALEKKSFAYDIIWRNRVFLRIYKYYMDEIIGRKKELKILEEAVSSSSAEFIAILRVVIN